jgi:hypothetical protein
MRAAADRDRGGAEGIRAPDDHFGLTTIRDFCFAIISSSRTRVGTACDRANESCPIFPGETERIHWSFEDPTAATGTDEEKLRAFRNVRNAIRNRLRIFVTIAARA